MLANCDSDGIWRDIAHMTDSRGGQKNWGEHTHQEIFQQPSLWEDTFRRVQQVNWGLPGNGTGILSGAGSSAFAAAAIQIASAKCRAVPSTDLLLDPRPLENASFLMSVARSGDSPECDAVVQLCAEQYPSVPQFAITCNSEGRLARDPSIKVLLLDSRTNDQSLVMTSSFSNITLAGLCIQDANRLRADLPMVCEHVDRALEDFDKIAYEIAQVLPARAMILASAPLFPCAQEGALKVLEMTAGKVAVVCETFLGVRHGPMSFLQEDTLVVCLLSSDPYCRRYEMDLVNELRAKGLGRLVAIGASAPEEGAFAWKVPAAAPNLPDYLRTAFEIVFIQLLAYHLSLRAGLNPDSPSPEGIIQRVVNGVRIYERTMVGATPPTTTLPE